jgi:hypothetical protein
MLSKLKQGVAFIPAQQTPLTREGLNTEIKD